MDIFIRIVVTSSTKTHFSIFQLLKDDGLPTNICHRCLYNTELFSQFRAGVHHCERRLQDFVQSLASDASEISNRTEWRLDDIINDQHESSEFYQNDVVVIDPLKCYASSEDEHDDEDDGNDNSREESTGFLPYNEYIRQHPPIAPSPQKPMAMPHNDFGVMKQSPSKMSFEDVRPLRNVCFCKYCEAPFAHRSDCDAHEMSHDRTLPYACNFCQFRCDNQTAYIEHIRQFHDAERPFFCTRCDKHFGRRADLRKHGVSHTGVRPFSCAICKRSFSRKTNVISHMKVHEGNQQQKGQSPTKKLQQPPKVAFGMPPAGYPLPPSAASMGAFPSAYQPYPNQMHQSAHYPEQQNLVYSKCAVKSEPNKIPKLKIKFKLKKPAAGAVKKFDCQTCKKSFKTKRDLDRHSQIHNGMKFQCSLCPKGFARRDKLVRHEKTHANRSKTAALPESAFLPENLKRSHFGGEHKAPPLAATMTLEQQQQHAFKSNQFRPQFYAEYDLSETNN